MATAFTFEAVSNLTVGGEEVSLALDKSGNPHIAFSEQGSGQIIVAQRNGGTWTSENASGRVGDNVRVWLAIDSLGNPRLGYQELGSGLLTHAIKSGGQWSVSAIPTRLSPDHAPGGVASIHFALHPGRHDTQSRDVGYFTYVDLETDGIGFAHTGTLGPTPVRIELDTAGLIKFAGPSATFDPSENYSIAYVGVFYTGSPQDTISIRETHIVDVEKGTFSPPEVLDGPSQLINVRRPTSIARTFIDGCVAYFDMANKTLKASVSTDGVARVETVATNVNNIVTPSVAAKGAGFRIAYADTDGIKLASRSPAGDWTIETVDAVSGGSPSLAYDNAGTANIAYVANGRLKYARRSE